MFVYCSLRSLEQDPAFEAEVEDCIYFKLNHVLV